MRLILLLMACATAEVEDSHCCLEEKTVAEPTAGVDFAAGVEGPARCAEAAASAADPWTRLWECVQRGRFTALRELLSGAWDHDLRTRSDAPRLLLRVIAERGGLVDEDLQRLHELQVPIFSLSQALARPRLYRGALVIVRAKLSYHGVLEETRVVSRTTEAQVGLASVARGPWGVARERVTDPRWVNLDVPTGQRVLALIDSDPFLDAGDPVVILARFEGLRDGDGWPELSVLGHLKPAAMLAY